MYCTVFLSCTSTRETKTLMYRIHILFLFGAYAFFMLFFAVLEHFLHVLGFFKICSFTAERGISSAAGRSGLQA
jgi:hypothetical protein